MYIVIMMGTVCIKEGQPNDYYGSTLLQLSKELIINMNELEDGDIIEKIYAKRLLDSHRLISSKIHLKGQGLDIIGSSYYLKIKGKD